MFIISSVSAVYMTGIYIVGVSLPWKRFPDIEYIYVYHIFS